MFQVEFDDEDAALLADVIDMHVQGIADAKGLTELDPTVDTAEQLLDLMAGYDEDAARLKKMRIQLRRESHAGT